MSYDNWKDYAVDAALTAQELRERLKEARADYNEEKRLRLIAHMDLKYARDALRDKGLTTVPEEVDEGRYECGECCVELKRDWEFCPGCGYYIDWHAAREYAEYEEDEGDRFLRNEVYEPLREAMRS